MLCSCLREQIISILKNATGTLRLIISDGGSTDSSLDIMRDIIADYPQFEIVLLLTDGSRLGVIENFSKALTYATADYVFISDQDDVWSEKKFSSMLGRMYIEERNYRGPILLTTDAKLIDDEGKILSESLRKNLKQPAQNMTSISHLVAQNILPGCTFLINRAALDIVLPIDRNSVMHDWWISSLCALCGRVIFIDESLHYYRLHASNLVGQPTSSLMSKLFDFRRRMIASEKFISQIRALIDRLNSLSATVEVAPLGYLLMKSGKSRFFRISIVNFFITGNLKKTGLRRQIGAVGVFFLLALCFG